MLSGILVAVLVVVWAVVLVPMWVRRYDGSVYDERSGRVLSRRASGDAVDLRHAVRSSPVPAVDVRGRILRRRRRMLLGLLGLLAVGVAAGGTGAAPAYAAVLAALPLTGYLVQLRRVAAVDDRRLRELRRRLAARRAERFRDFAATAPAAGDPVLGPAVLPDIAAAAVAEIDTTPWTPVPLPLPTYVTAPPAPRVVSADWHEEDLVDGDLPGEPAAYALDEEPADHRRAVGDDTAW